MADNNKLIVHFLGAAGTVTGSKYLLEVKGKRILVDCGLFQGIKKLRMLNWDYLPVDASTIDAVLLTHGHLDHTGYLPRLYKAGLKAKIIGTAPTLEVSKVILEDSARIQEEEAQAANIEGYSKHKPAHPLYTVKDVEKTCRLFVAQPLNEWITLDDDIRIRFMYNGHIIGASYIELETGGKRFVFSGDIGREEDPLMLTPQKPSHADVLFIESTYGGRIHPRSPEKRLEEVITKAFNNGSTVIIPSFAVERAQTLMFLLWKMRMNGDIPDMPVYMDSPMGRNVLDIFHNYPAWHKLPPEECNKMCQSVHLVTTIEETYKLAKSKHAKIIIAGSGMIGGGRVLTYLQFYLGDRNAVILLSGFQAEGTRGRQLVEGASELKIRGQYYAVKAKIEQLDGLSAHADQSELISWMSRLDSKPEKIFIVHGEPGAADAFRVKIKDTYGWDAVIPSQYDIVEIPLNG